MTGQDEITKEQLYDELCALASALAFANVALTRLGYHKEAVEEIDNLKNEIVTDPELEKELTEMADHIARNNRAFYLQNKIVNATIDQCMTRLFNNKEEPK